MIPRADAIERARAVATDRGWPWREPVQVARERRFVFSGRTRWVVVSHADQRGGNVRVVMDAADGRIVAAGFLPR